MTAESGQNFHFISGLPRSGSTLLAALLRQNPRFHAGMTSPVGTLFNGMLAQFSAGSEFGATIDRSQRQRLLRGLFANCTRRSRTRPSSSTPTDSGVPSCPR